MYINYIMGIWTDSNGQTWDINIGGRGLEEMQNNPYFKYCWITDTPGIDDENNANFWESSSDQNAYKALKNKVTVNCADGSVTTGKIYHWVAGSSTLPFRGWFILYTKNTPVRTCEG